MKMSTICREEIISKNARPDSVQQYLIDVREWFVVLDEHLRKLDALVGVDAHHVAQQEDVVGGVTHFLGVQHDLGVLSGLCKTLDHLAGHVGPQVDRECQGGVCLLDQISQLLRALQLVLLQPLLHQVLPSLLQHRTAQLKTLVLVQLTLRNLHFFTI